MEPAREDRRAHRLGEVEPAGARISQREAAINQATFQNEDLLDRRTLQVKTVSDACTSYPDAAMMHLDGFDDEPAEPPTVDRAGLPCLVGHLPEVVWIRIFREVGHLTDRGGCGHTVVRLIER